MKSTWGPATWKFIHVLCENAPNNEELFIKFRETLWSQIIEFCSILPCESCSKHSYSSLSPIKANTIHSKDVLILLMYRFHNHVNKRTSSNKADEDTLEQYKTLNLEKCFDDLQQRWKYTLQYLSIQQLKHKTLCEKNLRKMEVWLKKYKHMMEMIN